MLAGVLIGIAGTLAVILLAALGLVFLAAHQVRKALHRKRKA